MYCICDIHTNLLAYMNTKPSDSLISWVTVYVYLPKKFIVVFRSLQICRLRSFSSPGIRKASSHRRIQEDDACNLTNDNKLFWILHSIRFLNLGNYTNETLLWAMIYPVNLNLCLPYKNNIKKKKTQLLCTLVQE